MAKHKIKEDGIYFLGMSAANEVTGSQYFVKFGSKNILLECGLHQSRSNSYLDSYRINTEKFKFDPRELDYVFVNHAHIDHIGLIPRLVKEGFNGKIIINNQTANVAEKLLLNSAMILQEEARILTKRYKRNYSPIYSEDDVYKTLDYFYIFDDYHTLYCLDKEVSFQWFTNSHVLGSTQLQLVLSNGMKTRKILYTSDLGGLNTENHYVNTTEIPDMFNDVVIMESTYGDRDRITKKARAFDVEHLRVAVNTVLERKGSLVFPCFSFARTQELLTVLYDLFGKDESFNVPVIVDSKLSCDLCKLYGKILEKDSLDYWNEVSEWDNVEFISEKGASQLCIADNRPKIVISSSGFCNNGRILNYLTKHIVDENSMIVFSGFVGDNPSYLSYRIKNYKDYKQLKINHALVNNRADCITLSTFSSHANHDDLVTYGSSLQTNKIVLVHGSEKSKKDLQVDLTDAISKNNKSYKVLCSNKNMVVHL